MRMILISFCYIYFLIFINIIICHCFSINFYVNESFYLHWHKKKQTL